jgi:hypothetical protein
MGPIKTAQAFLLQDDRTSEDDRTLIELDAPVDLSLKKKNDTPLEDGSDDNGSAAELHDKKRKDVKNIYNDDVSGAVILKYLEALRETWGSYIDSASGERRRIDGSLSLLLFKGTSLHMSAMILKSISNWH